MRHKDRDSGGPFLELGWVPVDEECVRDDAQAEEKNDAAVQEKNYG